RPPVPARSLSRPIGRFGTVVASHRGRRPAWAHQRLVLRPPDEATRGPAPGTHATSGPPEGRLHEQHPVEGLARSRNPATGTPIPRVHIPLSAQARPPSVATGSAGQYAAGAAIAEHWLASTPM